MDRRLIGTVVAAACLAAASMGCDRSNGEQQAAGSTNMQSNGSSDPGMPKGDAGGWNSLVSQNGNTGSGPAASKEAGAQNVSATSQAIGNTGGSAAPGDK